jgi:hypothetical protein
MPDKFRTRERYGEAAGHVESTRVLRGAPGIPLKAFGNWRAKFKAEPQLPAAKLLYRRRGLSHSLSHRLSHSLSHMTNEGSACSPSDEGARPLPVDGNLRDGGIVMLRSPQSQC